MMKRSCVLLILLGSGVLLSGTFLLSADEKSGQSGLSGIFPFAEENRTPVTENADRRAGDNAFAAGDYAVAVSFYTRYLEECRKKDSPEEVLAAYERVLDALVLGKFTPAAVRCLAEYEKLLPENGKNKAELEIWRGEILCQQEKYKEAELLYRKLLAGLSPQDPRSFRVAFSYGLTLEKQKRFREAAGVFVSLWKKRNDKSFLWSRVFQHSVLCLAAAQQWQEAHSMLLEYPPETRSDNETYALLSAYLHLRQHGSRLSCGIWKNLLASFRNKKDPLWYLVASAYADCFLKEGDLHMAQNSYRAAFHAADDNAKIHETLKRMVAVLSAAGDVKKAAALAVRHLELFRHAMLKGDLKLQTAALLRDSARYKEALSLYESVFANMASSRQEREKALREYALILGKQGRLEEAAKTLRSNLQGKDAADAEFLLAEVLVKLGRKKEFFKVYETIAERWKEHSLKAWMLCIRACVDQSMPREALSAVEKLRSFRKKASGEIVDLYYLEAAAYSALKESGKALDLYGAFLRKSSAGNPLYPFALYHCGVLSFTQGRYSDAVKYLTRLKKECPDHKLIPEASAWLIQACMILNDEVAMERETYLLASRYPDSEYAVDCLFRLAQKYASAPDGGGKAVQILSGLSAKGNFPKIQARALYELALYSVKNNRKDLALKKLNKLYETFPDMDVIADAYYLHGDILRNDSDFTSAIFFYRKVTDLQKDTPLAAAAHGSIGDCLSSLASADSRNSVRMFNEAINAYRSMQKISSRPVFFDAMGYYRIGRCLESQGQNRKAAVEYLKVLYRFPAAEVSRYPESVSWCVRAAEALTELAKKNPLRSTLVHARTALHWLCDAGLLKHQEASERFEKLKSYQLNP